MICLSLVLSVGEAAARSVKAYFDPTVVALKTGYTAAASSGRARSRCEVVEDALLAPTLGFAAADGDAGGGDDDDDDGPARRNVAYLSNDSAESAVSEASRSAETECKSPSHAPGDEELHADVSRPDGKRSRDGPRGRLVCGLSRHRRTPATSDACQSG